MFQEVEVEGVRGLRVERRRSGVSLGGREHQRLLNCEHCCGGPGRFDPQKQLVA